MRAGDEESALINRKILERYRPTQRWVDLHTFMYTLHCNSAFKLDDSTLSTSSFRARGFGFVTYRQSSMVDSAMEDRPHEIDGRELKPKRAVPKEEANDPMAHSEVSFRRC